MVTVYLAGDSTVQTYAPAAAPQAGWGQFIAECFSPEVRVVNRAIGGRSSKTFVEEGRLEAILSEIAPGDHLLTQMGHNDSTQSRPERYTEPDTTYKHYLRMYVAGARGRGALPVLITPVGRLHFQDSAFLDDFPLYCRAMREVAAEQGVPLLDLMGRSLQHYTSAGLEEVRTYFMVSVNGTDHTHFTERGARQIARLVALGLRDLDTGLSRHVRLE